MRRAGSQIVAIRFLAGTVYVELMERQPADCPGSCLYTARIVKLDSANQLEIATAANVTIVPPIVATAGRLFWAVFNRVYRIH
jgi:hypothetical protein